MDRDGNAESLRSAYPQSYPQWPYNAEPGGLSRLSSPTYQIRADTDQRIAVRDGTRLALDVFRPAGRPGSRFPALVGFSPYTRQLQQTNVPIGQNEAGIKEFWVPRGYAMVLVDVRGTNDSEGTWDLFGPSEQADFADVIEWAASQPWCSGAVGMTGASYYARTQLMAAQQHPAGLKAIFAYDAATDAYRDTFFHGGIPNERMQRDWLSAVYDLNTGSGRLAREDGIIDVISRIRGLEHALDGEFYQERSAWPRLHTIDIPVYFGCHWKFYNLHLRGAFNGWLGTGDIPKKMFIGPTASPRRPVSEYHLEMLRWYDHWLKGLDTGVMDGSPIQLWLPGRTEWRSEQEWPLARTQWRSLFLGGSSGGREGVLDFSAGPARTRGYRYEPGSEDWLWGGPGLVYRTEVLTEPLEITGPLELDLWLSSSGEDTDILVNLFEEFSTGETDRLTRGWLRASHRAVDEDLSRRNQPWHPHTGTESLPRGEPVELRIEVIPTSRTLQPGSRLRLEIASSDNLPQNITGYHRTLLQPVDNTVHEGGDHASVLHIPVIE